MSTLEIRPRPIQRPDVTTPAETFWGDCVNGIWLFGLTEIGKESARRMQAKRKAAVG